MTHHARSLSLSLSYRFSFALISLSPFLSGSLLVLHLNTGWWCSAATPHKVLIIKSLKSLLNLESNHSSIFVFFFFKSSFRMSLDRKDEKIKTCSFRFIREDRLWSGTFKFQITDWVRETASAEAWTFFTSYHCCIQNEKPFVLNTVW